MRRTFLISRIILVSTVKWLGCDHLGSMRCRKTLLNNSLQYFWLNSTRLDVGIMKREFTWSSGRKNGSGKSGIYEECLGWDLFYCFLEGSVPRHIVGLRWLLGLKYIFFFVSFLQSMRCLFFLLWSFNEWTGFFFHSNVFSVLQIIRDHNICFVTNW